MHTYICTKKQDRKTERQKDRKTERQKDRKTERQKDIKTERQTDRQTKQCLYTSQLNFELPLKSFLKNCIILKVSMLFCLPFQSCPL